VNITYSVNTRIDPAQLCRLYGQTSWATGRLHADVEQMLKRTALHVSAWDDGKLIGYARSVTDTVYRALVDNVIVDAPYRGKGIGTELVRRIGSELENVDEVFLGCDPNEASFYKRLGYKQVDHPFLMKMKRDD
jgi:predicted GNAT family N-acyltransferase